MLAVAGDATTQLLGGLCASPPRQHAVEPAVQIGSTLRQRGVEQAVASPPDGDRAQQQPFERHREGIVAAVDRVLRVAQQMREADLPDVGMAALAAQAVGDPARGNELAS